MGQTSEEALERAEYNLEAVIRGRLACRSVVRKRDNGG